MRDGWTEATLGEVCQLNYGKPLPKSDRKEDGAYSVLGANGIKAKSDKFYHEGPSIIVGRKGSAGEVNIASDPFWPLDVTYFTTHDEDRIEFAFLHYWLVAANLPKMAKGVKPGINRNEVYALPIRLPSLEEQRGIVAVLDEAFACLARARENVEKNLAAATELKVSTSDQVFQSFVKSADVAKLPLNEVCSLINGRAYKKEELLHEGKYRVLRVGNFFTNKNWYYSDLELPESKYCEKGDLLYAWSASFGPRFWQEEKVIYHYHIWKIEPDVNLVLPGFLFHFFEWDKEAIKRDQGAGATMIHVSKGSMEKRIISLPDLDRQRDAIRRLDSISEIADKVVEQVQTKLTDLYNLRQSILERAFGGELAQASPSIAINDNERDERISTATLVLAYEKHHLQQQHKTFGHVKAQKTLHLTESISGLDLGRQPKVRLAGPHDQEHFDRVEAWAAQNGVFKFEQRRRGGQLGYDFIRGKNYDAFLTEAKTLLANYQAGLSRFLPLITQMNTEEAEVFTTVHAAWNNLLADGKTPSDEDIVWAAREGWHESKRDITRQKFFDAIREIRRNELEPDGSAKYVHGAQESLL